MKTKSKRIYHLTNRCRKDQRPAGGRPANETITPNMVVEKTSRVVINSWEEHDGFYYVGFTCIDEGNGHWGYTRIYKPGIQRPPFAATIERTEERYTPPVWSTWQPKPGDRGYDLMC